MSEPTTLHPVEDIPEWMQRKERGSVFLLQLMTRISLFFGRRTSRILVYAIAFYFLITVSAARKASRGYLNRALQRPATWVDLYRHILSFATTIHDRFYLLNDQADLFDIKVFGAESISTHQNNHLGVLMFGAHLGSFEVLLSHGRDKRFNFCIAMYPENARQLNHTLASINPQAITGIVALGRIDSMLTIHHKLEIGAAVGILADRASGPDQYLSLPFLGSPARFPTGPFRLAAMLGRPVYFMAGIYRGGNRYELHFKQLADFAKVPRCERDEVVRETLKKYVTALEGHCRVAPYNWFNFFEFWELSP